MFWLRLLLLVLMWCLTGYFAYETFRLRRMTREIEERMAERRRRHDEYMKNMPYGG